MIKIITINKINKFKQKFHDYFLMKKTLQAFSDVMKNYYVISVGFNEIYYGIKNPKRFKLCILFCIMHWIVAFYHLVWVTSDYIWTKTNGHFLPAKARIGFAGYFILFSYIAVFTTDLILGQINSHLSPFKVFYPLINDIKVVHKLNDRNYKRLAIFIRIMIICMISYGKPIFILLTISWQTLCSILSCQLYWFLYQLFTTPIFINMIMAYVTGTCFVYSYFPYYKLRFDQFNDQIKSIIPNGKGKIINKKIENQLVSLIDEHNQLAIEVNGMNMMLRRTAVAFFITLSLIKIMSLYLMIYMKELLLKILVINVFCAFFFFGFGMSLAFSLQIKSAHQCSKLIYSIINKHKMKLPLRFKVNFLLIKLY